MPAELEALAARERGRENEKRRNKQGGDLSIVLRQGNGTRPTGGCMPDPVRNRAGILCALVQSIITSRDEVGCKGAERFAQACGC